ncbi:putative Ig domain-containing protein [Curtobacterium sp. MCBA15_001]|uniref:putative Ig domain-containing protein n=1 Tax=Curtobacterium sp. MCBA15_001 TaxID=1898731 RepID=UPI0008DCE28C|nr:putative Ig domain-containing protein [Curtobacterium sp. MCBA15_001]OIH92803.1 hypothetical protein BIU90_09910 [Curtobacterium sp. MCBA15_001]
MTTHSTSGVRRYAAVGTVAAMLVGSAAIGITATTAQAAEPTATQDAAEVLATATPTAGATATATPTASASATATPDATSDSTPGAATDDAEVGVDAAPAPTGAAAPAPAPAPAAEPPAAAPNEDVAFAAETSNTAPRLVQVTAGAALDESVRVVRGSGTVTYTIGYVDPSKAEYGAPEDYLPAGAAFDGTTGTLTGTVTTTGVWEFTVIASNGTSSATEFVQVEVLAGAPAGITAWVSERAVNGSQADGRPFTQWLIERDGRVTTITPSAVPDTDPVITYGGRPTVSQGASLAVSGNQVDAYGNPATQYDAAGNAPEQSVTSDNPTDVLRPEPDSAATAVTFPNASTHVLTVTIADQSVSFPVTVVPRVAATTGTPTTTRGELAFTGSDTTDALPWGIAMLAAGAGLIGLRTFRRRTQR